MNEQRRKSPLTNFVNLSEKPNSSQTTPEAEEKEEWKYETFKLRTKTIEKLEDYLYLRQGTERFLTKQELYDEAINFYLESKGEIPPMPDEARERLNQRKDTRGRKKKA